MLFLSGLVQGNWPKENSSLCSTCAKTGRAVSSARGADRKNVQDGTGE